MMLQTLVNGRRHFAEMAKNCNAKLHLQFFGLRFFGKYPAMDIRNTSVTAGVPWLRQPILFRTSDYVHWSVSVFAALRRHTWLGPTFIIIIIIIIMEKTETGLELRGLCIREIDVESQTLVTEYYIKLRFPMPWRSAYPRRPLAVYVRLHAVTWSRSTVTYRPTFQITASFAAFAVCGPAAWNSSYQQPFKA